MFLLFFPPSEFVMSCTFQAEVVPLVHSFVQLLPLQWSFKKRKPNKKVLFIRVVVMSGKYVLNDIHTVSFALSGVTIKQATGLGRGMLITSQSEQGNEVTRSKCEMYVL